MKIKLIRFIKNLLKHTTTTSLYPPDFEDFHIEIIKKVRPYSMTSNERLYALIEAVKYVVQHNIPGDLVECGVWKGGSMMAVAETLLKLGVSDRKLYLYDTFAGMTAPTDEDKDMEEQSASELLIKDANHKKESVVWAFATIDEVKNNISTINYPSANIHFVKGDILKTIPATMPEKIALLRLDTDWYESTRHEMKHLYPKLCSKGVLIIDDYGFWKGSRKAVDEYIANHKIPLLLNRIDDTGRTALKF